MGERERSLGVFLFSFGFFLFFSCWKHKIAYESTFFSFIFAFTSYHWVSFFRSCLICFLFDLGRPDYPKKKWKSEKKKRLGRKKKGEEFVSYGTDDGNGLLLEEE